MLKRDFHQAIFEKHLNRMLEQQCNYQTFRIAVIDELVANGRKESYAKTIFQHHMMWTKEDAAMSRRISKFLPVKRKPA